MNTRSLLYGLVLSVSILIAATVTHAVPASRELFPFEQPDGRKIMLRVCGDEWFHWYETADGYPVTLDRADKTWVYTAPLGKLSTKRLVVGMDAPVGAPWRPEPAEAASKTIDDNRQAQADQAAISIGTGFIPVLLGNFSDTTPTVTRAQFNTALFSTTPGARSMSTYFTENSYGRFTVSAGPSGTQDWVTVPN